MRSATPILFAAALLAAGCGGPPPAADAPLPVIRWGVMKNYNPVFLAQDQGYFRQEGIQVELVGSFSSGPAVLQAAAADAIDAGHSAITGIVAAKAAGVPVVGVLDSQTEFADAPLMQWFVLEDSPIRDAHGLRGKRIGVNALSGSFYYTVLIQLERSGIAPSAVELVVLPHHHQEQALRSGQIDVAGLIDPYSVHIRQQGGVRTLFRAVDILGERQFSHVFFRLPFVQRHPEAVKRFVRAYVRAIDFISSHPEESSSIMSRWIGVSAELVGTHRYTPGATVRPPDVQFWIDQMRRRGALDQKVRLLPEDVATNAFTSP